VANVIVESRKYIYHSVCSGQKLIFLNKCDRQMPCSHVCGIFSYMEWLTWPLSLQCVARRVPDLCKAYTPGKVDQELSIRVSRLEHIIEQAFPRLSSPETPSLYSHDTNMIVGHRSPSNGEDDNRSQTEVPVGGVFQSGKWYGNGALGSVAPTSVSEQVGYTWCGRRCHLNLM
jgi:hypothetical protein